MENKKSCIAQSLSLLDFVIKSKMTWPHSTAFSQKNIGSVKEICSMFKIQLVLFKTHATTVKKSQAKKS